MRVIEVTKETLIFISILSVFALIAFVILVSKVKKLFKHSGMDLAEIKLIRSKWASEVEKLMAMKNDHGYKLAVLEADKLLDHALKSKRMPGKDLGGRLKSAVARNPKIRPVWGAHIIRNKIAHDPNFTINGSIAKRAIKQFKQALIELGVL